MLISPPTPMLQKMLHRQNECEKIAVFRGLDVCLPHSLACSVIYHGQSIEISSKRLFMVAMALAIGLGYDHRPVGRMMAVYSKCDLT